MALYKLSVRMRTRVSQITADAMQPVKQNSCKRIMTSFRNRINNPKFLVNMDETAVFLNCTPIRAVDPTGERTVSIRVEMLIIAVHIGCNGCDGWNKASAVRNFEMETGRIRGEVTTFHST